MTGSGISRRGPTLSQILSHRAREQGEELAHVTLDGELRYRTWDEESSAIASGLQQFGIARGEVVGLAFDGRGWLELAVAYIGVHRAGATCLLMNYTAAPAELRAQVSMLGGRVVISNTRETLSFPDLLIDVRGIKDMAVTKRHKTPPNSEDIADIIFTSGTTGSSRAVACTHANVAYECQHRGGPIPWEVEDGVILHARPPIGAGGQGRIAVPLLTGLPLVSLPVFDPQLLCEEIVKRFVRHLSLAPAMATELVNWPHAIKYNLSSVVTVGFGSAPLPSSTIVGLAELFPSARLFNQYSSTEALPSRVRGTLDPDNPDMVGRPDHDTSISIRDPETAEELHPGEVGEIWLSTPGVRPRHYVGTAPDARSNEWVRMGDLGRVDESGRLKLVGRLKEVINRGGVKISPAHVERALESLPEVIEAAVFAIPHRILGEDVAAALVTISSTTAVDIRCALRDKLGQHQMPQIIVVLDELPRGPTGKIQKRELVTVIGEVAQDREDRPRTRAANMRRDCR
ncbi:MAG: class I adenylate-forming enzyme family protein [Gammaproteobacteria bacterium]|nr:class I adenylate-forming enzyme family protein [Gammaproteobacteria bacterium]